MSSSGEVGPMRVVHKAFALVARPGDICSELLIFDHPMARPQIPKGTVEPGEDAEAAALRELEEESGLTPRSVRVVRKLRVHQAVVRAGPAAGPRIGRLKNQHWHLFLMEPTALLADAWNHIARGSMEERGLCFRYRWLPLDDHASDALHPHFHPCLRALLSADDE